jgi:Fibroblast growth factor
LSRVCDVARLRVETAGFNGRLRIRNDRTGRYLCFNQKGQLTVMVNIVLF